MRSLAAALVLLVVALVADAGPTIPRCFEDQVLIGAGEFESGLYARYECGPAVDDYVQP